MDSDVPAAVEVWTDGGCKPNPGPGGWGAILKYGETERELSGADGATTNNRMELTAAASALEALKRPCKVVLHTDSEYVRNGMERWVKGWVRNNWRNAAKDPVANYELWQRLLAAAKPARFLGEYSPGPDADAAAGDPVEVSWAHVEAFQAWMIETRSASTALNKHKGLQQFFKWLLLDEDEIDRSPMERVRQPMKLPLDRGHLETGI